MTISWLVLKNRPTKGHADQVGGGNNGDDGSLGGGGTSGQPPVKETTQLFIVIFVFARWRQCGSRLTPSQKTG